MKNKLMSFFVLLMTMSLLTASREDSGITKVNLPACSEASCPDEKNDYALNTCCKKTVVAQKVDEPSLVPVDDNELSLSPISRFILLQ
jgi:hypothetical protein